MALRRTYTNIQACTHEGGRTSLTNYIRHECYVFTSVCWFVCVSVCLSVSRITQKVTDGFERNNIGRYPATQGPFL